MIQRIQTIFLFLVAASFGGLFGLPFAKSDTSMEGLFEDQIYNIFDNPILIGMVALGIILAIIAIFMYKNRKLQVKIVYGVITIAILTIIVAILLVLQDSESEITGNIQEGMGLGLPIFSIIFGFLANRYIKKDDKLVKSMDRLR